MLDHHSLRFVDTLEAEFSADAVRVVREDWSDEESGDVVPRWLVLHAPDEKLCDVDERAHDLIEEIYGDDTWPLVSVRPRRESEPGGCYHDVYAARRFAEVVLEYDALLTSRADWESPPVAPESDSFRCEFVEPNVYGSSCVVHVAGEYFSEPEPQAEAA